jgi:hypothetical protein
MMVHVNFRGVGAVIRMCFVSVFIKCGKLLKTLLLTVVSHRY